MSGHLYLAYGSNLHPLRLTRRLPKARLIGVTALERHRISYGKVGSDRSGKCTIHAVDDEQVYGALYQVSALCRRRLDIIEGGYRRIEVKIDLAGKPERAFTYVALPSKTNEAMRPFAWYRDLVIAGARFHGFPESYLEALAAIETIPDPDSKRRISNGRLAAELGP
ncbi:MAG: gamma-glutamylcyclotransferase family protein [Xanthomonadales bacterium]|nr:gamma-glutamylcyclotransferase family protein [Xanthomonadales bacterium]